MNTEASTERLVAIREGLGLTQMQLAEKLGVSPKKYASFERGEREWPPSFYKALYARFQIDPMRLLTETNTAITFAAGQRVDIELVVKIVNLVERHLINRRARLAPDNKARLIQLFYDHCTLED